MNGSMEKWFRAVRVRKGCLLLPTLFSIFIEQIMSDADALEYDEKVSISSRNIIDLQFVDDKDAVAQGIS